MTNMSYIALLIIIEYYEKILITYLMWIVYIRFDLWNRSIKMFIFSKHDLYTPLVFVFLFFFFFTCLRFSRFLISLYLTISFFYFFLFQPLHPLLLSYSSNCSIRFRSWTFRSEVFVEDFIVQRPHFRLCLDLDLFFLFSFFSMFQWNQLKAIVLFFIR